MKRKKHLKASHFNTGRKPLPGSPHRLSLPIEIVRLENNSFHPIVNVEIDGMRGDMILDTGASVSVVDRHLFPEPPDDKHTAGIQSGSVTGQIENVRLIRSAHFRIGGRNLKNIPLAVIDLAYVNHTYHQHLNRKIIGLLGCDFCVKFKAVIDYRKKELTLNFLR